MNDPKYQHGSSADGWMEQNDTPRTDASLNTHSMINRQKWCDKCGGFVESIYAGNPMFCRCDPKVDHINKLEADVAKLNHQLLKTENDLLQSQDINSFLDTEFRIACKRAEKAEAEVERLDHLLAGASETNHKLGVEVLVLKKELAAWDYGTRAKREQERAEKAEAEAIQLKAQLNQALAIATGAHEEIGRFFRGDDYTRIGMEIYELKLTIK
jgi:hypothetical protein